MDPTQSEFRLQYHQYPWILRGFYPLVIFLKKEILKIAIKLQ